MRSAIYFGIVSLVAATLGACAADGTTGTSGGTTDSLAASRTQVVARINQLRATVSLPALTEWTAEESCADGQAQADAIAGTPHSGFGTCHESAQSECPIWPTISQIATGCIQAMWNQGPGADFTVHGDYTNMTNTTYHKVAVGFYTLASGDIWAVTNFAP